MARYAADTQVPVTKSIEEIERTLARYGATAFGYARQGGRAVVQFAIPAHEGAKDPADQRRVRFDLTIPKRDDFRLTPQTRQWRSDDAIDSAWEKAQRQQWRALLLFVKATLEAVEAGLLTIEEAFLAHIALPDGTTTYEWMGPQLAEVYATGDMPELLPPARAALEVSHG